MPRRVLHVLSQRPLLTGSGITLDALVRQAAAAGWDQAAVVGTPADDPSPPVGELGAERIHPLRFGTGALAFPLPGMSDVMPYASSRFSRLTPAELRAYRRAWRGHLARVAARERPDLVHAHHAWILASMLKDLFPRVPIVTHCHATGLRQLELCPHLAGEVRRGLRRNERFLTLHAGDRARLRAALGLPAERVRVVGAGYREDLFHLEGRRGGAAGQLLYVGKYSSAKGLPWLLEAVERLRQSGRPVRLHVAGGGSGAEARKLEGRMQALGELVVLHGSLTQPELAALMRRSAVCVLPSFYEGLPLVLVEAAACGCRLVATALEGVSETLAPHLGPVLELVPLPRLAGVDTPVPEDLPRFVERLCATLDRSLAAAADPTADPLPAAALRPFTWAATFARVEAAWKELVA